MDNETIHIVGKERIKKWENRWTAIVLAKFSLGIFGFILMIAPLEMMDAGDYGLPQLVLILVLFYLLLIYMIVFAKAQMNHEKVRRNYFYNLVRKDEQNKRVVTKLTRD